MARPYLYRDAGYPQALAYSSRIAYDSAGLQRASMAAPADYLRPGPGADLAEPPARYRPRMASYEGTAAPPMLARAGHTLPSESTTGDRYVKLLERDIEALREELRVARERADNPELVRELRTVQDQLREESRRVHDLEAKLHDADNSAAKHEALQAEHDALRDELRQQRLEMTQLERDLHHAQDSARSATHREDTMAEQIQRYKEEMHAVQKQLAEAEQQAALQARQAVHDRETAALQHSRELTNVQNEIVSLRNELRNREQESKAKEQSIEALEARLKKEIDHSREVRVAHDRVLAELREAKGALENDLRSAMQENGSATAQLNRRQEMIRLLESETGQKTERIAQQEEQLTALRNELSTMRTAMAKAQGENNSLQAHCEDLQAQLATSESLRREVEGQEEKFRSQLDELAHALLATETQRRSGLIVQRVEEVMSHLKELEGKVAGLQTEKGTLSLERGSKDAKISQLEEALGKGHEQRVQLEEQITHLREELLARTRELKDLTLAHEALHREQRQILDRYARVEEVVGQKQEEIEGLKERINQARLETHSKADELRDTLSRTESDYQREIQKLKSDLARLQDQALQERQYADVCRRLGRLLQIDPNLAAGSHAERIYERVLELQQKAQHMDEATRYGPRPGTSGVISGLGGTSLYDSSALRHSAVGFAGGPAPHFVGLHEDSAKLSSDVAMLRAEVEKRQAAAMEERMAHNAFVRDVGRAVEADDVHDMEVVLAAVKEALRQQKMVSYPMPPKESATGKGQRRSLRTTKLNANATTSKHDEEDFQKLKKRLTTALKTIESQDMWIDVLNRKLESSGGGGGGNSGVSHDVQMEMRRLEDQVAYLKQQLAARDASRPGSAMPTHQITVSGAGAADLLAFKSTIADLEARLQKHIEFREKVIQALGLSVISAPDHEILRAIEQAVHAARGLQPMQSSSTLRMPLGFNDSGLPASQAHYLRSAPTVSFFP